MSHPFTIEGRVVDLHRGTITEGSMTVENGRITALREAPCRSTQYILPGFIDAHVHIESSMLVPAEFARLAVVHGSVGSVCDPHEIANVLGRAGVEFMVRNAQSVPFKFCMGVPSCVPATDFETPGARLDVAAVAELLEEKEYHCLSEMMNFPGVLHDDPEVMAKIAAAQRLGKPVDGHSPGLRGDPLRKYLAAGITTDHECFELDEAREKAANGMMVSIREGSAAKNFDALIPLLAEYPEMVMFCSDDKHPDDLVRGHINLLVARAVARGFDPIACLRAACLNPVRHYSMPVGLLREGDAADFIVVQDLETFRVLQTYIDGVQTADKGESLIRTRPVEPVNVFAAQEIEASQIACRAEGSVLRVIEVCPGELVTRERHEPALVQDGFAVSDPSRDILKLVVLNRYERGAAPAIGFVKNIGLQRGALASSVAHDSHNIVAVGASDQELARAIDLLVRNKGGIVVVDGAQESVLPLPVAGLMSAGDGYVIAEKYQALDAHAKRLGSTLAAPFMMLSFLALLVIPSLKLSDKGLFNGEKFEFVSLFVQ